jgi:hypothetical protein
MRTSSCKRTDLRSQNACGLLRLADGSSIGANLARRSIMRFISPFQTCLPAVLEKVRLRRVRRFRACHTGARPASLIHRARACFLLTPIYAGSGRHTYCSCRSGRTVTGVRAPQTVTLGRKASELRQACQYSFDHVQRRVCPHAARKRRQNHHEPLQHLTPSRVCVCHARARAHHRDGIQLCVGCDWIREPECPRACCSAQCPSRSGPRSRSPSTLSIQPECRACLRAFARMNSSRTAPAFA